MPSLLPIKKAIISVFDTSGLSKFSQDLHKLGVQFLSTEGTAKILSKSGITVQKISEYIDLPEIMNKRIKTLHHKICAGILSRKGLDENILNKYNIQSIDMIIVNFYPFDLIIQNQNNDSEEILEYIDIGGPTMVRSAAKNYKNTIVIVDHNDYTDILDELNKYHGSISLQTRFMLAVKAFKYITKYDSTISNYFNSKLKIQIENKSKTKLVNYNNIPFSNNSVFPETIKFMNLKFIKKQNMRYGENPHQKAALYTEQSIKTETGSTASARQLQGKKLSYNNIIDIDTALECVKTFILPTCVIVKHANPCSVATSDTIGTAYYKAYQADPISAFGGIIAFNRTFNDEDIAKYIIQNHFVEAIIAPDIHQNCLNILSIKKNIRILKSGQWDSTPQNTLNIDFKRISKGLLIQDCDHAFIDLKNLKIVTQCHPTKKEIEDALFCWKIVKFVKSNAIVCGKNNQTTGIGSGQMNRILSVKLATSLVLNNKKNTIKGSVMASDAFFPFPDFIHIAAEMGIRCIIQPGGSIQDSEIIKTANNHNIVLIFTNIRHFRH